MIEKDSIEYYKEVILQVLTKINTQIEEFKLNDEISAIEKLENEVISKYEKLYSGFETMKELPNDNNLPKYLEKIMVEFDFTEKFIEEQMELRKKYQGKSGAEVVKKLFEYEIKKLKNIKYKLLDEVNLVLDEEEKLGMELKDAIQEEFEIEIIYKLQPVRKKYRELEAKVLDIQGKIDEIQKKLDSKWQYEIYGTISESEMLETFEKTIKK